MKKSSLAKLGTLLLLVLGLSLLLRASDVPDNWTWDDDPSVRKAHADLEGKPMPKLEVSDWINGEVKPDDMKGKVVMLDFFATWCGPCMRAIPHNNELLKKYKDKGLVIVGVCTSESGQDELKKVAKEHDIQYPTAKDPDLKAQKAFAVNYYPTYALVDRKGTVRVVGLNPEHLDELITKLLAEKPDDASAKKP